MLKPPHDTRASAGAWVLIVAVLLGSQAALAVPTLTSLSKNPTTSVMGGCQTVTITANLSEAAPTGGTTVSLSSNKTELSVPATLTVPAGATSASTTLSPTGVTANVTATVTGTLSGSPNRTTSVTITPVGLDTSTAGLTLNPTSVTGGNSTTATVKLQCTVTAGPVTIGLASNNSIVTVPSTVTIAQNTDHTDVTVTTTAPVSQTSVAITATSNLTSTGYTRTKNLTVNQAVFINTFTIQANTVGGNDVTATLILNQAAPTGGASITLTSDAPSTLTVPSPITIAAGQTTGTFTATTVPVSAPVGVTITARLGSLNKFGFTTVQKIGAQSVLLAPTSILGMSSTIGTVTLERPAGPNDIYVTFTSSSYLRGSPPSSITIPKNSQTGTFYVVSGPVTTAQAGTFTITANAGGKSATSNAVTVAHRPTDSICDNPADILEDSCLRPHLELTTAPSSTPTSTEVCLEREATFHVPAMIPVVAGNAGNAEARLLFQDNVWAAVDCLYRGGSSTSEPTTTADIVAGQQLNLVYCEARTAGDEVPGLGIMLEVTGGAATFGPLTVALDLTEDGETPPTISVGGVTENAIVNHDVNPTITVTGGDLVGATLDGNPFISGSTVSAAGDHVLVVEAGCGPTTAELTRHFTIDKTNPVITVSGVVDGERRNSTANISVSVTEAHPGSVTSTLDGTAFTTSTSVSADGSHTVIVTALDAAGNSASKQVVFTIDQTLPAVTIVSPAQGSTTTAEEVVVVVTASDASGIASVTAGADAMGLDPDGKWRATVQLSLGQNAIDVVALDEAGNSRTVTLQIERHEPIVDAGFPDAGFPDAGFPDAGFPDAGFPDAGFPDAGPGDLVLSLATPAEGLVTAAPQVSVSGHVSGGTSPISVAVQGEAVTVSSGDFSTSLSLAEGDFTIDVQATDAANVQKTATRHISVDRTNPYVSIIAPAFSESPPVVTTSPLLVQGEIGDVHLAEVTINGEPVTLFAGALNTPVALEPGLNLLAIRAVDEAGNATTVNRAVIFSAHPPVVSIVEPTEDATLSANPVAVRVQVAPEPETVIVNGASATLVEGVWLANINLVEGRNLITAHALDENGAGGDDEVNVTFHDLANAHLAVLSVSPDHQAEKVEPDEIVSLVFNKAVAEQDFSEKITLKSQGQLLPFGTYRAPDGSSLSLIAKAPLPESAVVQVSAEGLEAADGFDQESVFRSEFTVRRPLTGVVGVVLDSDLIPVAGATVRLEGTNFTATVGADGHWAFFDVPPNVYRVVIEGPTGGDQRLTRIRPRIVVEGERITRLDPHFLMVVDEASATHVDGTEAYTAQFHGDASALRIASTATSSGLQLKDGRTSGTLTATRLPAEYSPFPLEGRLGAPVLWTVQPQGTRVRDAQLRFPNATGIPTGRKVIIVGLDDLSAELRLQSIGDVTADGIVASEEFSGVVDAIGYLPMSEAQEQAVMARLNGTGPQPTLLDDVLDVLQLNVAHAQSVANAAMTADVISGWNAAASHASLQGQLVLANSESLVIKTSPPLTNSLRFGYQPEAEGGTPANDQSPVVLTWKLATPPPGMTIKADTGAIVWTPRQDTSKWRFDVIVTDGRQHSATQSIEVTAHGGSIASIVTGTAPYFKTDFEGLYGHEVKLGASGRSGQTGLDGGFGINVPTYGGSVSELAIVKLELGSLPIARLEANGRVRVERITTDYYARSPDIQLYQDGIFKTSVVVDATVFAGTVRFVDANGELLLVPNASTETHFDEQGNLTTISQADVETTEVMFFSPGQLSAGIGPIAAVARPLNATQTHHGEFKELRVGPRDLSKIARSSGMVNKDQRVLSPGDDVVMFAINHATGYAGLLRTKIGPVSNAPPTAFGNIQLFPPEIDVFVGRELKPLGVQDACCARLDPKLRSYVRSGGLATTSDRVLSMETHWRVRTQPATKDDLLVDAGPAPDGGILDAGRLVTVADETGDPSRSSTQLVDEGGAGQPLEKLCSELDSTATPRERLDCLNNDATLTEVPDGVPPLAAHVVGLGSSASFSTQFNVGPGRGRSKLIISRPAATGSVLGMDPGTYLVHAVGRSVLARDKNRDGKLSDTELNDPPPQFEEDDSASAPFGLPKNALSLKSVYTARLKPENASGPIHRVESYDRAREASFRIVSVDNLAVSGGSGETTHDLSPKDGRAAAQFGDDSYLLSFLLTDPGKGDRASSRTKYDVRIGSDESGVDCRIETVGNSYTATCDGEYLPTVLAATDIVYLEFFEGTNSDNVVFRMNFYGVSNRVENVGTPTLDICDVSHIVDPVTQDRANHAPLSRPDELVLTLNSNDWPQGGVIDVNFDGSPKHKLNVVKQSNGTLTLTRTSGPPIKITPLGGASENPQTFVMALDASTAKLCQESPILIETFLRPVQQAETRLCLERPQPRVNNRAAHPVLHERGHTTGARGVDLADGHLSFDDVDLRVPEYSREVVFARTFNNQNLDFTAVGTGWTHNHNIFLDEEASFDSAFGGATGGRYAVVIGGQQYTFPRCEFDEECKSDGTIDATLRLTDMPQGYVKGVLTRHDDGSVLTFDRPSIVRQRDGQRRTLLTDLDDGLPAKVVYEYETGSDNVLTVYRDPGLLKLEFSYDAIASSEAAPNMLLAIGLYGVKRLKEVKITRGGTVIDRVELAHDYSLTPTSCGVLPEVTEKQGRLTETCRPMRAPRPHWRYSYVPLRDKFTYPKPQQVVVFGNEISNKELFVTELEGPEGLWSKTSYGRNHPIPFPWQRQPRAIDELVPGASRMSEIVTDVHTAGWTESHAAKIKFPTDNTLLREVTQPNELVRKFTLNKFGAVALEEVAGKIYPRTYENDDEGRLLAERKRALPKSITSNDNTKVDLAWDTERHRATQVQTKMGSSAEAHVYGLDEGGALRVEIPERDERFGIPTTVNGPAGGGARVSTSISVDDLGNVSGVSLPVDNGSIGFTMAHDTTHGMPTTGTNIIGDTVSYAAGTATTFGQPPSSTTTAAAVDGLGLLTVTRHFIYDDLGRLVGVREQETGRETVRALDALGREHGVVRRGGVSKDRNIATRYQTFPDGRRIIGTYGVGSDPDNADAVLTGGLAQFGTTDADLIERTTYDAFQRVEQKELSHQEGELEVFIYHYQSPTIDDGMLRKITSSLGSTTFDYDNAKLPSKITSVRTGTSTTEFERDENGNTTKETTIDHLGRKTITELDQFGRPVSWTHKAPAGSGGADDFSRVERDTDGRVVFEAWGTPSHDEHSFRYTYDVAGRLKGKESVGSTVVVETYDPDESGRPKHTDMDPSGLHEDYEYKDVLGRMTRHTRRIETVNEAGNDVQLSDDEQRDYHDAPGDRTVTVTHSSEVLNGASARTTRVEVTLDAMDRVVKVVEDRPNIDADEVQHTREVIYDDKGLSEQRLDDGTDDNELVTFDRQGSVTSSSNLDRTVLQTVDATGVVRFRETLDRSPDIEWEEEYNGDGDPVRRELRGAFPIKTTWTYPGQGKIIEDPPTGVAANIERTYNARGLLLKEVQGPITTTYTYDGQWPKSRTTIDGNSETSSTTTVTMDRDDAGRMESSEEAWNFTGTPALGYSYTVGVARTNASNPRKARITSAWGNGAQAVQDITEDSFGSTAMRVAEGVAAFNVTDARGRAIFDGSDNAAFRFHTFDHGLEIEVQQGVESFLTTFDRAGRPYLSEDPLGHTVAVEYLGTRVATRHSNSFEISDEVFNEAGFRTSRTVGSSTWSYEPGPLGELRSVTLPTGDTYTYEYDEDRKLTKLTPPGGAEQRWAYNDPLRRPTDRFRGPTTNEAAHWQTTWTAGVSDTDDPLHHHTKVIFDGRGRAAHIGYDAGRAPFVAAPDLRAVTTVWDGTNQPRSVLEEHAAGNISTSYAYDHLGRVTAINRPGAVVGYSYDDDASPRSMTTIIGTQSRTQTYDNMGRVSGVAVAGGRNFGLSYLPGGQLENITVDGSLLEHRSYNATTQRLESINLTTGTTTSLRGYGYDERGNRLTETVDGEVTRYVYDAADRLTGVRYPNGDAERYALRGDGARAGLNRFTNHPTTFSPFGQTPAGATATALQTYEYDDRDGLLRISDNAGPSVDFTTDRAGRVQQQGARTFNWDVADRLLSTTANGSPSIETSYTYDAQGWRTRVVSPTEDRSFIWGAQGLEAEGATGATPALNQSAAGLTLGVGSEAFGHDALGSTVLRKAPSIADAQTAFDAWGRVRPTATTGLALGVGEERVGYTGHNNDATDLVYAQARYLDPTTGRFLSLDPVAGALDQPLSTQGWTYAHANPTRFTDPTGQAIPAVLAVVGEAAATGAIIGGGIGGVVGGLRHAYVHQTTEGLGSAVLQGAAGGAVIGSGVAVLAAFAPAAAAAVGYGGAGISVLDAGAKQVVARTNEFDDEELVREADADTAVAVFSVAGAAYGGRVAADSRVVANAELNRMALRSAVGDDSGSLQIGASGDSSTRGNATYNDLYGTEDGKVNCINCVSAQINSEINLKPSVASNWPIRENSGDIGIGSAHIEENTGVSLGPQSIVRDVNPATIRQLESRDMDFVAFARLKRVDGELKSAHVLTGKVRDGQVSLSDPQQPAGYQVNVTKQLSAGLVVREIIVPTGSKKGSL